MEIAKVTSKGQITIPVDIRKKLGIREGDKVLFVEEKDKIVIMNASLMALQDAQLAFAGEAEKAGIKDDTDIVNMIKEIRREQYE